MRAGLAQAHWPLILIASVAIYIVTLLLGIVMSFPVLAFLNSGRLDSSSASRVSFVLTAALVIIVTGYGSLLVARRVEHAAMLHGFLVGLVVAVLSLALDWLFRGMLEPTGLILYALMVASGALGGVLGSRRRAQP